MKDRTEKAIWQFISVSALIILALVTGIILGVLLVLPDSNSDAPGGDEITNLTSCENLSLLSTAHCMRNYLSPFYNYTIRTDMYRSMEEIKKNGGDCYDYNNLYKRMAQELGFHAYSFRISTKEKAHRIAVVMDDTGYCLMDLMAIPKCHRFKEEGG